ncbi:hypothetical protein KIN20_032601 [Parelaphostrongylus tenuis]|uniref:Uncharacterized protein n=1 Tax=Parelaphostrongylus tenuis TaxID=148309 RepID=A0AAD5R6Q8_PARTN|nr:hypothetical protein KIN20_032601 [Parelaphostrongylus tenuis]
MGAIYKVIDKNRRNFSAALKVEDDRDGGGVLKLEVSFTPATANDEGNIEVIRFWKDAQL